MSEQFISVALEELLNASIGNPEQGVPSSMQVLNGLDLPASVSLRAGKMITAVDAEIQSYNDALGKMHAKYDKLKVDGVLPKEKEEEAEKEHRELINTKVSILGQPIKVSELGDVKIAPIHLARLGWLIIE